MHNKYCLQATTLLLVALSCFLAHAQTLTADQIAALQQQQGGQSNNSQAAARNQQASFSNGLLNQDLNSQVTTNQSLAQGQYPATGRQGVILPGEQRVEMLLPPSELGAPAPYGANLFAGGYESERIDGLNDDYLIAAGDKINIWMWGAVNFSQIVTVDNQGNIFIPNIGPVMVANTKASQVNALVTQQIKQIYQKNVQVYVNLLTATPVSVYLAGPVIRPGQYAGMASDSVLYFLKRAGGIDADRGSYRHIKVIRKGQAVVSFDLYDFMRNGQLPDFTFKDKDVILVEPQGAAVTVVEGARNPFRFEFSSEFASGQELATYARPLAKISHVGVIGTRRDGPFSVYMPYADFTAFRLSDGDRLIFNDDWDPEIYDVQVSGSHLGPSYYTVRKQTRLYDLLSQVEIDPVLTDFKNIYILRESVALRQKEMIDQSLDRLERSVYTAPVQSTGEGTIRAQEAGLVSDFVRRAKQIQPLGKVIVSEKGKIANILLEQGDEVVIPQKSDLIHIGGEVLMPQSVVFNGQAGIQDYVAWAGGYTERANYERILIVHANGLSSFVGDPSAYWMADTSNVRLHPGDQILVLPKIDAKALQAVKDITQIIYQIAVAANVVLD
ncbi:polysaccharide biosynthesis/export family protein [Neiella marina]|uniref:Polysaccharide biosynthesis/export family protein n=1 Tax=Neiella holothuriorum TaxID=2870530 RepID=A0ABS7EFR2_9GAMM|nr:polysaccharide biosynthesis/export family protein [Neiella holothuriorum]MBW8190763.1 polysaccharide biosynthesis/export family protein [Neiella holothuriorum]